MEEEKSVKELLQELVELQKGVPAKKNEPKVKSFWMPFSGRISNQKARKGWVTVMKINDNRNVSFEKQDIDEQTVIVDGVPRIATADETLIFKGKPLIILPSWSTKPFSPTDSYEETVKMGYASQGYKLLLNRIKNETINQKKKISGMLIFGAIAALIAIVYFAYQGGLFK